jgi:16S rRNA (cytosine1402-N4)-methyltransferase
VQEAPYHTPVLSAETLSLLITAKRGVYIDATLGGGGHAEAILRKAGPECRIVGIDADEDAIFAASKRLVEFQNRFEARRGNFKELRSIASEWEAEGIVGVLFDLGVSSRQLDDPSKGFSFRSESPLDMRMDRRQTLSAQNVLNEYSEEKLAGVLWNYGEERYARKIARVLVQLRSIRPIESGKELARIIEGVVGERFLVKTLARVFQAIRIEVNDELETLKRGLSDAIEILVPGGRLAVISYHSLEDRIVKETMKTAAATSDVHVSKFLPPTSLKPSLKILTKKFIGPGNSEIRMNPRARSAKLRAAEKV